MVQPSQFGYFYNASWTERNYKLQCSTIEKLTDIALSFFRGLANKMILPSTKASSHDLHNRFLEPFLAKFQNFPLEITSADGAKIRGTFLNKIDVPLDAPCIIFFQPEGKIYEENYFQSLIQEIEGDGKACNFVVFDHRGIGTSEKCIPTPKQLLLDADSIYQFVSDGLGVSEDKIIMAGTGFGAAIAAQTKALHNRTTAPLLLDRTFSSPIQAIYHRFGGGLKARIAAVALKIFNWQIINTLSALQRITSQVFITYTVHDKVLSNQSHLFKRAPKKENIKLQPLDNSLLKTDVHQHDLKYFFTDEMKAGDVMAAEFITEGIESDLEKWEDRIDKIKEIDEQLRRPFYRYIANSYYLKQIEEDPSLTDDDICLMGLRGFHDSNSSLELEHKIQMLKDLYSGRVMLAGYSPKPRLLS